MVGRDDAAVVDDLVVPSIFRQDHASAHAVRFAPATSRDATPRDVVVPAEPALTRAAPRRVAALLAGRYCAARALRAAGYADARVPVGEAGAPAWPAGAVGSISHTAAYAVAVVGSSVNWRGIGVDCERVLDETGADDVVRTTLPEADAVDVAGHDRLAWTEFVTVAFSAKESLYKCLRPLIGEFFDFTDARLTHLHRDARHVRLRLERDLGPAFARGTTFDVAFAVADAHAYTRLALPVTAGPIAPESIA